MGTAYLVAGLAYGDEGKGATVDFLVRTLGARLVVRYNGGAQAGHNVVTPEGQHHTFAQFGSGTFVPGVWTYLSRYMMVNPLDMMLEEEHLRTQGVTDAFERVMVDAGALVTTPFQRTVNKVLLRESGKHNSCGMGIGQTREDNLKYGPLVLFARDLKNPNVLKAKLKFLQSVSWDKVKDISTRTSTIDNYCDVFLSSGIIDWLVECYSRWPVRIVKNAPEAFDCVAFKKTINGKPLEDVIFEGAQGVLLDEEFGEEGFNTWSKTTFHNCPMILNEAMWQGDFHRIGVLRTYITRHGDGPLVNEASWLNTVTKELHNDGNGYPGKFRKGLFSYWAIFKALEICGGVDSFALNHFDEVNDYDIVRQLEEDWAPVSIIGTGPTAADKKLRLKLKEKNDVEATRVVSG